MSFLEKANESQRRTSLMHSVPIDWHSVQQIAPVILNGSNQNTQEFNSLCSQLHTLCTRVEEAAKELKTLIPTFSNE